MAAAIFQNQSSSYQTQLGKRKDMLTSTEQNLRAQITQLEEQLQRSRDTVNSQVRASTSLRFD